jgi:hypothetical protein
LTYLHNNPVKRGLVKHRGGWLWSGCRFYFRNDGSILGMDKMLSWHQHTAGRIHPDKNRRDVCATRRILPIPAAYVLRMYALRDPRKR